MRNVGKRCWLRFWTRTDITDRSLLRKLLGTLSGMIPEAFPTRWGLYEPYRICADPGDYERAVDLAAHYDRHVSGKVLRSDTSVSLDTIVRPSRAPFDVCFWIDTTKPKLTVAANQERIVALFNEWIKVLRPDYARTCMQGEWTAKNTIEFFHNDDGSITSPKVYGSDINEGLPGVYWMTYFGAELSDWFGTARLAAAPWPDVAKLAEGYLLRRSDDLYGWQSETETALDAKLIRHLGAERFFDIRDPNRKIESLEFRLPMNIVERYRMTAPPVRLPQPRRRTSKSNRSPSPKHFEWSVNPKDETEQLMNEGMLFAKQMLVKHGEFFPFAVTMSPSGQIEHTAIGDQSESAIVVSNQLESALRAGASTKQYRAIAIVINCCVQRPEDRSMIDAVHVGLEHMSGYSVDVFFPYSRTKRGEIEIGDSFASERPMKFFAPHGSRQ